MKDYLTELEELFYEWKENYSKKGLDFIKDGIPCPEVFEKEKQKVLFILKEANDKNSNDQLPSYSEYASGEKDNFKNKGIKIRLAEMYKVITDQKLSNAEAIKRIAFLNLKKVGGESVSTPSNISKFASEDRNSIIREINIINPDFIVCCGCFSIFYKHFILGKKSADKSNWRKYVNHLSTNVVLWKSENKEIKIIDMYHPSYSYNGYSGRSGDITYINEFKRRLSD